MIAKSAQHLACESSSVCGGDRRRTRVRAHAVIIATGAEYRRLPLANLSRFEGTGVYYGATFIEAQLCSGDEVIVVGGGNSAGQAAVFLAETARKVYVLVRAGGLAEFDVAGTMIRRIDESPNIELRTHSEITALEGTDHLEQVQWREHLHRQPRAPRDPAVFVMTGAAPNTAWLKGCVVLDDKAFIKTGPDLSPDDLQAARWPLPRGPHLLETSLPGVFAVGDVRSGNVKRVAAAVGEGSIAISLCIRCCSSDHRVLTAGGLPPQPPRPNRPAGRGGRATPCSLTPPGRDRLHARIGVMPLQPAADRLGVQLCV